MVLQATVQRSPTYTEKASEKRKGEFRDGLRTQLETLASQYSQAVTEEKHFENVKALSDILSEKFSDCLVNGRFRIGSAQKSLNLHLKYLWCLGKVGKPPHCPFDNIVINKLSLDSQVNWTELDDIDDYKKLVEQAKKVANGASLAEWELQIYNVA